MVDFMVKQTTAYIGLGSNLGDRQGFIDKALKELCGTEGVEVAGVSDFIETAALGDAEQPEYLNAAAQIKTTLSPQDLHKVMQAIETSLGRVRGEKWSARTIDLDLLLFGQEVINLGELIIPHPQMHLRSFVLKGLCQLDDRLEHPVMAKSVSTLAARLGGTDFVLKADVPQLVSVAGIIGVGKTTLARELSKQFGCDFLPEPYDTNPFLPEVYAGKKELALDSQLYFLTERGRQLDPDTLGRRQVFISDYVFEKELIYARRLLDAEQLALYEEIYPVFSRKVASSVLVIYMTDSVQQCLGRIHQRNRPYEQRIKEHLLEWLSSDYERLFADWKSCPVIRIEVSRFDCTKASDIEHLVNQIKSYIVM